MSVKTIELVVCDKCGKEITGTLSSRKCPCCGQDFCLECERKANEEVIKWKPRRKVETELPAKPTDELVETPSYNALVKENLKYMVTYA